MSKRPNIQFFIENIIDAVPIINRNTFTDILALIKENGPCTSKDS